MEVFCKKGVLRNFTKFTGKHLWQSLFFNKVAGLRPVTMNDNGLTTRSSHRRCSVKKGVLKNFTNLTGKHLCWSLFFDTFVKRKFPKKLQLRTRTLPLNDYMKSTMLRVDHYNHCVKSVQIRSYFWSVFCLFAMWMGGGGG